jgi:hypothetical protein
MSEVRAREHEEREREREGERCELVREIDCNSVLMVQWCLGCCPKFFLAPPPLPSSVGDEDKLQSESVQYILSIWNFEAIHHQTVSTVSDTFTGWSMRFAIANVTWKKKQVFVFVF